MRSRGLVVAIAIVLAIVAAAAVILYTEQVKKDAFGDEATQVVISTVPIPAATRLDLLLDQGAFDVVPVSNDNLVEGAITDPEQLRGLSTTAPILAREQITEARLTSGSGETSQAGVSEGHIGVALTLDGQRAGAGAIRLGDNVAVYVTFGKDTVVLNKELKALLAPAQLKKFLAAQGVTDPSTAFRLGADFTTTLVPSTRVIQIAVPTATNESGEQAATSGEITLMLDLLPEDGQAVVFANERASIWLGLLPPENKDDGYPLDAFLGPTLDKLVLRNAA